MRVFGERERTYPDCIRSLGKEEVHYEAPPSNRVPKEIDRFIKWYHQPELPVKDDILKSAIAYLVKAKSRCG